MRGAVVVLVLLPTTASADDRYDNRVGFAANMTVGEMYASRSERTDSLGLLGYTFGATIPLSNSVDVFVGLGIPFTPAAISVDLPVRVDWQLRGRWHSGPVVHAGVRPTYADVNLCTYDLTACPQGYQDTIAMSTSYEHPGPPIHSLAAIGELGAGYQWVWEHAAFHTSLSYLGGYVHGVHAKFEPIDGYYQGFVVQLGIALR